MFLKKIIIENLRSYENQEIKFPIGSTLLSGDIGSGKTTILLAIEFALFGLQPSQKGSSLLRSGKEEGRVVLEMNVDGKDIIIERVLKKNKKSISQDYSAVSIDGERFEGSISEIKSRILRTLNYPPEFSKKTNLLYKFTVYTPQEEMKQIILEPGDIRLNTLRHVFGIDRYKRIEENLSILCSKLRERIRLNEGMVYGMDDLKNILEQKKKALEILRVSKKKAEEEYEEEVSIRIEKERALKEITEKIEEKKSFENEKSKSLILLSEKHQQIRSIESSIRSLNIQVEEARKVTFNEEEYNSLDSRIQFQEKKESELQEEYISVVSEINSKLSKKSETETLKSKIFGLEKCPTCLQEVSEEYKRNILEKVNKEVLLIEDRLKTLSKKRDDLDEKIETTKKVKETFKKRKSELELIKIKSENLKEKEDRIMELKNQIEFLKKDSNILNKHLKNLEESITEYEKYNDIYNQRNLEVKNSKERENKAAIKKAEVNKEIQFLEEQIKEKEQEIKKKEDIKKKSEKIKELEYWLSKKFLDMVLLTEKQVMLALKEEFSKLFSDWFSILVSDNISVKLDDTFSPVIEQQDYEIDYNFLSGGERTAVALAYRLALNQVINSVLSHIKTGDLVILDEPTDGFSSQQLDKMREVLNQLNVKQLILVSHEPKIEGFVDNLIRIRKEFGITRVE
jgi:DNA repair protein SbcC/Rad50